MTRIAVKRAPQNAAMVRSMPMRLNITRHHIDHRGIGYDMGQDQSPGGTPSDYGRDGRSPS